MKEIMITGISKDEKSINLSEIDMENIEAMKTLRMPAMKEEYLRLVDSGEICRKTVEKIINSLLTAQTLKRSQNTSLKRIKRANLWYDEASVLNLPEERINVDRSMINNVLRFNFIKAGSVISITGGARTGKPILPVQSAAEPVNHG